MVPELSATHTSLIRIPNELDVSVTRRVRAVIDTPAMQRLKHISQLGLVARVYPGATHSRFEHSLGVYRLACQVLQHLLASEPEFSRLVTEEDAKIFLLAALLHDVGHWPYCHPMEDLQLPWVPKHESMARHFIADGELADVIRQQWQVSPTQVADFLSDPDPKIKNQGVHAEGQAIRRVLQNALNGPVDIDKMDYLQRDSLHAGVPYGRNFDLGRLIGSLCIGADGNSLAITEKGKTAAEMMVFARYVMFSEVYWHHAIRSATAMLQRIVFALPNSMEPMDWFTLSDADFGRQLMAAASEVPGLRSLAEALLGPGRRLYKRFAQYDFAEDPEVHGALAGRPYSQLVVIAEHLANELSQRTKRPLAPTDILIDAPPVKLEIQFKIQVRRAGLPARYSSLASVSPVVKSLATEQFDNFVKRVRVFVAADRAEELQNCRADLDHQLLSIAARCQQHGL